MAKRGNRRRQSNNKRTSQDVEDIWIYGVHPVEEYLDLGGRVEKIWICRDKMPQGLVQRFERDGLEYTPLELEPFEELCQEKGVYRSHQGVLLKGGRFGYADLDDVMREVEGESEFAILALDQVQDVGNLGAILRSAAAFGVVAVLIPEHRSAQVTGAVIRASAGQALRVKIVQVGNMTRALQKLKSDHACWVLGTILAQDKSVKPWEVDLKGMRAVWVVGGEHDGVRRLVGEQCDILVEIPMAENVESLNVASAASVVLYETVRQQKKS